MNLLSIQCQYNLNQSMDFTHTKPVVYSIDGDTRTASSWIELLRMLTSLLDVEYPDGNPGNANDVANEIRNLLRDHRPDTHILITCQHWITAANRDETK